MIYEMRTYTMYAGQMPAYLKAAETIGRPARGDNYGINHGYWTSEFGQVNQIWHLWSYPSLDERERLRAELQKNPKWTGEYVPAIRGLIIRQDLQIWNPVVDYKQPTGEGNVYELRTYRTHLGQARPWANLMKEYLPVREKYSPIHGLWTGEFPQPNSAAHLWVYKDLAARTAARAGAAKDPKWQEFVGKGAAMLAEMQSVLLLPTSYSKSK